MLYLIFFSVFYSRLAIKGVITFCNDLLILNMLFFSKKIKCIDKFQKLCKFNYDKGYSLILVRPFFKKLMPVLLILEKNIRTNTS